MRTGVDNICHHDNLRKIKLLQTDRNNVRHLESIIPCPCLLLLCALSIQPTISKYGPVSRPTIPKQSAFCLQKLSRSVRYSCSERRRKRGRSPSAFSLIFTGCLWEPAAQKNCRSRIRKRKTMHLHQSAAQGRASST